MSIRTVADLIKRLEEFEPESPIALASQPSWPFEYGIADIDQSDSGTVYVVEGSQTGYLPGDARRAIGW